MALCIKTAAGDILWFDAVTDYSESYSSSVSSHPLETGSKVSDHTIRENPKFSIKGVFSSYDPNTDRSLFNFIVNDEDVVQSNRIVNNNPIQGAMVNGGGRGEATPRGFDYTINPQDSILDIKDTVKSILLAINKNSETVTILDFDNNVLKANGFYPDVFLTNIVFAESSDSGDALYVDLDCEKVSFVDLQKVTIPRALLNRARAKNKKPSAKDTAKADAPTDEEAKITRTDGLRISGKFAQRLENGN